MPALVIPAMAASDRTTTIVRADEKTGHLVRSVTVQPREVVPSPPEPAASETPLPPPADTSELIAMIDAIAAEQGVEDSLVHSVIRAESNYNARAVSPKGALGMMQLIPSTAKRFGVGNAFDPRENVRGGVKYLKFLLDYYHDDYVRAIAAYNAGEAAVDKYNGVPPYLETRNYVYSVAKNLKTARDARAARKPSENTPPAETYRRIETSVGSDGRIYYRTP
jgi:soluble lytic murein transglycosylase-like protein